MRAFKFELAPLPSPVAFILPLVIAGAAVAGAGPPAAAAATVSPAAVIAVGNCNDSGPGSLRSAVAGAASGDTIDLRSLTCRRIVLGSAIAVDQDDLTLLGPTRALLVDGNRADTVFRHSGTGTLRMRAMSIGYGLHRGVEVTGGCIDSLGSVRLEYVRVHHCVVDASGSLEPSSAGGGIAARNVSLFDSAVDANVASSGSEASGGGVWTGHLLLVRSQIRNNAADIAAGGALAGTGLRMYHSEISGNRAGTIAGIWAGGGDITVAHSTIAGNQASSNHGGAYLDGSNRSNQQEDYRVLVINSTISGNSAGINSGLYMLGVFSEKSLLNSTIAFNHETSPFGQCQGALDWVRQLHMESTIVARNTCDSRRVDIGTESEFAEMVGADNLVGTSTVSLPPDTISAEPRISPLADNGGRTRTHALWAGSPAVDMGNNNAGLEFDQRGPGFARVKGGRADIGAYER